MVFNFSLVTTFYTCRICKDVPWTEIPKCVCAQEDRVHIASNILQVREKFFINEGITKLAKKKYENRPINFSRPNEHSSWYSNRLRWSRNIVFSASPQKNQSKKLSISIIWIDSKSYIHYVIGFALVSIGLCYKI